MMPIEMVLTVFKLVLCIDTYHGKFLLAMGEMNVGRGCPQYQPLPDHEETQGHI